MPKIQAPTVREHHEAVEKRLVDAAENLLRSEGPDALTAGAVSSAAGIARNSIYRYVESVDDLRGMVMGRYLPAWIAAVDAALDGVDAPRERVVVWARSNLEQAATSGHGWLMRLTRGRPVDSTREAVDGAHYRMGSALQVALEEIEPGTAAIRAEVIYAMVDAGFRRLDAGDDPLLVIDTVTDAVVAMLRPVE